MKLMELDKTRSAKSQIKKLAKGRAHSLDYDVIEYTSGDTKETCSVYIDGYGYSDAGTWDEALALMRDKIRGQG